jgi:hypothetical protein
MAAPAPPEKGTGLGCTRPIGKLTGRAEDQSCYSKAQPCEHRATVTERLPDGSLHYARLSCAICGAFLRWLPKPATIERQRLSAFRIARLAMCSELNSWEHDFVANISQQRKLSPRQQEVLDELVAKYLEAKPS